MRNISLKPCKSFKQTCAFTLVCLFDFQLSWEMFPVFQTKDGLLSIYMYLELTLLQIGCGFDDMYVTVFIISHLNLCFGP